MSLQDSDFISRCLHLALKGGSGTSPNPLVGAVVAKNGKIVAEGYHRRAGLPHAEIEALKKIGYKAKGGTLYCNLEPCCHSGKTPPCVPAIISSGIKRVVISHIDPNPLVSGRSVRLLRKNNIQVTLGVFKEKALFLNRFFITWMREKRPYVILKMALSLDGKIARSKKSPPPRRGRVGERVEWITGPVARKRVHEIRSQVDAILVGVNTILVDDPRLTVRGVRHFKQPVKIVLDSRHRTPPDARIFKSGGPVLIVGGNRGHRVVLPALLRSLAKKGITSVLVEGGGEVFRSFYQSPHFDELILHVAPKVLGSGGPDFLPSGGSGRPLHLRAVSPLGRDIEYRFLDF